MVLLVSRKYGAEGTGIYSLTTSLLNSLAIFGGLGLNIAVLRYVGQFNKAENGLANMNKLFAYIFQLAFPFSILVGIALFFIAEEVAIRVFENPTYVPALKAGAIALPFFTLNLINVEFIRGLKMLKVSEYLRSINRQIVVLLIVGFSLFSFGILDAVYAMILGIILSFIISLIYILRFFKKNRIINISPNLTKKEVLKTSMPMMTTAVASFILANAGAFLLEMFSTTDQVGIFNVCLKLALLVSIILVVVNTISAPNFAELYWNDKLSELKVVVFQASKIIFFASSVVAFFIIVFSDFILNFFGLEFVQGKLTLIYLVIGQIVNAITGSVGVFLNMSGHQGILRNLILVSVTITIVCYILLVPKFGMEGAAIGFLIGSLLVNVPATIYVKKRLNIITYYYPGLKIK